MMPTNMHTVFDIALIGMGIQSVDHMTLEAVQVLAECKTGFVVSMEQEGVDAFRDALLTRISNGRDIPHLHSLSDAYQKERIRSENYLEAAQRVLDAVPDQRPVAFLTPGHPMVLDSVSQAILDGARKHQYKIKVVNGVSCVDSILASLHAELAPGIQIFEANCAMLLNTSLDSRVACILLQTSVLGTLFPIADQANLTQAWTRLRDYLGRFYPLEHSIFAVRTGDAFDQPSKIYSCSIASLGETFEKIPLGSSLYVPGISKPAK
jgi:precorrin-2 methylase